MKLEDDHHCFVCGELNNSGLKLRFDLDKNKRSILTGFVPGKAHQGFKDIVHGGIIGMILDECMVNLAWKLGIKAVTAEYTVRLVNPAYIGRKLLFSSRIVSEKGRMLIIEGDCREEGGERIATSFSKCLKI